MHSPLITISDDFYYLYITRIRSANYYGLQRDLHPQKYRSG